MSVETNIPTANIDRFEFPESAKIFFKKNIRESFANKNPYKTYNEDALKAAGIMMKGLGMALANSGEKTSARRILELINNTRNGKTPPAMLISNFPVDKEADLLDTPTDPNGYDMDLIDNRGKKDFMTEYGMLAFNTASGNKVMTNPNIQGGIFTQHLSPRKGKSNVPSNAGAGKFPVHIEGTHLPEEEMIDALTLAALKNKETPTIIIPLPVIEEALRKSLGDDFKILKQKRFKFVPGPAYNNETNAFVIEPMVYVDKDDKIVRWRLNANLDKVFPVDPSDDKAKAIIAVVAGVLESLKQGVVLRHGDFASIDNVKGAAHSRTPIAEVDKETGKERHLLRQQVKQSKYTKREFYQYLYQNNVNKYQNGILNYIQ